MSHFTHNSHHEPAGKQEFGRGVTANQKATIRAFDKFYSMFPSFIDIFPDEDAFLEFALYFFITTIVGVIIVAKYVKIKPSAYF